jgi:fatty acid desaturase
MLQQSIICYSLVLTTIGCWSFSPISRSYTSRAVFYADRYNIHGQLGRNAIAIPHDQDTIQVLPDIEAKPKRTIGFVDPRDEWVMKLDFEGFGREVNALGKQLLQEGGQDDVNHLNKVISWRNAAAMIGILTMWTVPNPITVLALSTWTFASWTMIGHHTCHGGYNRVDAGKYNSRGFALGSVPRRIMDWLDWMLPEAWNVEHNRLHHYRLNEETDPDLVQRNTVSIRENEKLPTFVKYVAVGFLACVWKWYYYAPNTFKELQINKFKAEGKTLPEGFKATDSVVIPSLFAPGEEGTAIRKVVNPFEFFLNVVGPFLAVRYILLPAPLLAIPVVGPTLFINAISNIFLAEVVTNIHSFITIVTNHAGEDLYTFDDAVKPKSPAFYVRQIVGSANYDYGKDSIDFWHGYLNYQIEHHVWPDLSMLQYQKGAPRLKEICDKYGVPYIKESVFERLRKTVDIMIGKTSMRPYPTQFEPIADKAGVKGVTWKNTHGAIDDE